MHRAPLHGPWIPPGVPMVSRPTPPGLCESSASQGRRPNSRRNTAGRVREERLVICIEQFSCTVANMGPLYAEIEALWVPLSFIVEFVTVSLSHIDHGPCDAARGPTLVHKGRQTCQRWQRYIDITSNGIGLWKSDMVVTRKSGCLRYLDVAHEDICSVEEASLPL